MDTDNIYKIPHFSVHISANFHKAYGYGLNGAVAPETVGAVLLLLPDTKL